MKKNICRIIGLLLLLPLFSGCNDTDDVAAIFTGKTWKLNYITVDGGHETVSYTHLDVYKRQGIFCSKGKQCGESSGTCQ